MPRLFGQDHVVAFFRNAWASGRRGRAYLLVGPDGVGKFLHALECARGILCRDRPFEPCEACGRCSASARLEDPNLFVIERSEEKKSISIEQLRPLEGRLTLKPVDEKLRIVLVRDADRLSEEAANWHLKALEDSPLYTQVLFLLTVSRPDALPATVHSRCQTVRFLALPEKEVARYLVEEKGIERDRAAFLARFSGGSLGRALALTEQAFADLRAWIVANLSLLDRGDLSEVAERLIGFSSKGDGAEEHRRRASDALEVIILCLRDLLLLREGVRAAPANPEVTRMSDLLAGRDLGRLIDRLIRTQELLAANVNPKLATEHALLGFDAE